MKRNLDLILILILTVLQLGLVFTDFSGWLRVATGFLFMVLLPGYSFLAAFYRSYRLRLSTLEHVALAIPVSLALNVLLGLIFNAVGLGLEPRAHAIWMGTLICGLAGWGMARPAKRQRNGLAYLPLLGGIMISALALGGVASMLSSSMEKGAAFSLSLYVLGANDQATRYPSAVKAGTPVELTLGGGYQGLSPKSFRLTGSSLAYNQLPVKKLNEVLRSVRNLPGKGQAAFPKTSLQEQMVGLERLTEAAKERFAVPIVPDQTLDVKPGQNWTRRVKVVLDKPGLYLTFWNLYQVGLSVPLRSVQVWLEVK